MSTPLYHDLSSRPGLDRAATGQPALQPQLARAVLGAAAFLGITGDALLHEMHAGVAFGLWIALVGLNAIALLWRAGRTSSRETTSWLAAAVLFALAITWRNSETLQAFDILASFACLAMAAISTRDPRAALFARRLRDTLFTAIDVGIGTIIGVFPLAFREAVLNERSKNAMGRLRTFVRPVIIAAVALLIFGSLLMNADPIFASIFSLPSLNLEVVASHVVLSGFLAWIVAGWARAGLTSGAPHRRSTAALPIQLDTADISAALGTLIVLFGAFIATQLGWFFGGEQFLRARTGLTAAKYAREGFFQMLWVVMLVVPVLVGTRAALRPDRELARRHTLLSIPVVVLLGAIIVSAMLRMKMYVHYYGLTIERFYPLVFMLWLAVVIGWLAVTVLRSWGRPFVAGAVLSGLATLLALNVADPDAIVARVNIARGSKISTGTPAPLDLNHLSTLEGGGVALATRAILDRASAPSAVADPASQEAIDAKIERCVATRRLLNRWGPASETFARQSKKGAWRWWNFDNAVATQTVSQHADALRSIQDAACAGLTPEQTSGNSRT